MITVIVIAVIVFYLIGILADIYCETMENVKLHDGGFLNMGYSTCDHRDATTRDVRMSLIWPLRLVWFFVKGFIMIGNDIFAGFLLVFNYRFKETKTFKKIERWSMK